MPNQTVRQIMPENFQDSLRLVRHLMNFSVEEFAEAVGLTSQIINNLETKKVKLSATQYVAVAALTDSWFANHAELLPKLKAVIDGGGKNYGDEYETSFRDDSLLKRWFEDFVDFDDATEDFSADEEVDDEVDDEDFPDEALWDLAQDYKIFLDAETLFAADAEEFVTNLTTALSAADDRAILPLRSVEQIQNAANQDPTLQAKVSRAIALIQKMQSHGVLQIFGEETDPDFHDTVVKVFEHFRNTYPLCLVTPNEQLARDVLMLNDSAEDDDFEIAAAFVVDGLINFYGAQESPAEDFQDDSQTDSDEPEDKSTEREFNGWSEL